MSVDTVIDTILFWTINAISTVGITLIIYIIIALSV